MHTPFSGHFPNGPVFARQSYLNTPIVMVFQVNLAWLVPFHLGFLIPLVMEEKSPRFFLQAGCLLLPNQQCQSTAVNSKI